MFMQPGQRSTSPDRKNKGRPNRARTGPVTPVSSRPRRSRREYAWIAVSVVVALVMLLPFFGSGVGTR
jgi:hypothetical protein